MNNKLQSEFCKILDDWYLEEKGDISGVHSLGRMKEDLKSQVCKWIEGIKREDVDTSDQEEYIKTEEFEKLGDRIGKVKSHIWGWFL